MNSEQALLCRLRWIAALGAAAALLDIGVPFAAAWEAPAQDAAPGAAAPRAAPQDGGQDPASQSRGLARPSGKKALSRATRAAVTPEHEAAVQAFVDQNHPELAELLGYLKRQQPQRYQQAVRTLYRTWERMSQFRQRDPERYELELEAWSAKSHGDLLAARLKISDTPELRLQCEAALRQHQEKQLQILKWERQRLADRLQRLDQQIQDAESTNRQQLDKRMRQILGDKYQRNQNPSADSIQK